MMRQFVQLTLLTGILMVEFVPVALTQGRGPDVVATITGISKKTGQVTLQTDDGTVYRIGKKEGWKVGDKVICYQNEPGRKPQLFDCRPWS